MQNNLVRYIISFIGVLLLQVLVFSNFTPGWSVHLMVYPMLIISLPFDMKPIWLMLLAFISGIIVDTFANTYGLHASASVFIAYARPELMKLLAPKEGYDHLLKPSIKDMGLQWYLTMALVITLIHHLWFFIFESFNLYDFGFILLKTILSTLVSVFIMISLQYIFFKATKEK